MKLFLVLLLSSLAFSQEFKLIQTKAWDDVLLPWPTTARLWEKPNAFQFWDDKDLPQEVSGLRVGIMVTSVAAGVYLAYEYAGFKEVFNNRQPGNLTYGLADEKLSDGNIDKLTHFTIGYYFTNILYDSYRWTGMDRGTSFALAIYSNAMLQLAKEVKDGFREAFSGLDWVAGVSGGILPLVQYHVGLLRPLRLRVSYDFNGPDDPRFGLLEERTNHDYWFTYLVSDILPPSLDNYWPDPLGITVATGGYYNGNSWLGFANRRYAVGLDWDWENWVDTDRSWLRRSLFYAGAVKMPNLSVFVYPDFEVRLLYPFRF